MVKCSAEAVAFAYTKLDLQEEGIKIKEKIKMGKKRVEEASASVDSSVDTAMENVVIDSSIQEMPMTELPKKPAVPSESATSSKAVKTKEEVINCLRNEKVCVRFIPKPTALVQNPKHILYGGMADTATRSFVVPRYSSTGLFKNVLTNNEKAFLEKVMGLEYDALSIYKKQDNFWDDSNPMGIGRVTLTKQDNYLDLSVPEDYIKYKILLANKDQIASSMQELEDKPKATYQFVIVSENAEAKLALSKMDVMMNCYKEYGKIEDDADTLRVIVELLEGRPTAPRVKLEYLQGKVNEFIQSNPRRFLSTIKDDYLPAKVLIKKCVEKGLIGKKNDAYYLRSDGSPLCEMNEDSTLNNAAKYISSIKHQDLKYLLEAKVKE